MALYLDNQTRPYLENKFKVVAETDFIGKRIQGMLKSDRMLQDSMANCKHEAGTYKGAKTCCVKCNAYFEVGMGENWKLEHKQDKLQD